MLPTPFYDVHPPASVAHSSLINQPDSFEKVYLSGSGERETPFPSNGKSYRWNYAIDKNAKRERAAERVAEEAKANTIRILSGSNWT
jgi:hypothetical protein